MSCIRYCRNGLRGIQCSAQRPNQSACNLHCNDVGMFPVLKLWEVAPNQSCSWDFCPCLKRCFWIPSATGQHSTKIVMQLQGSMARRWGNLFHTKVSPLCTQFTRDCSWNANSDSSGLQGPRRHCFSNKLPGGVDVAGPGCGEQTDSKAVVPR